MAWFTYGSSNEIAVYDINRGRDGVEVPFQAGVSSAPRVESKVVFTVFKLLREQAFQLYTDCCHLSRLFPHIETVPLPPALYTIFLSLQDLPKVTREKKKKKKMSSWGRLLPSLLPSVQT